MRYDWLSDCPLPLQDKLKNGSRITLEFELSADEQTEFQQAIGSKINGALPISILFEREDVSFSITKPGKGFKTLNAKADRIARFVAERIDIQYIPAVRTADSALQIVEELVARELATVEEDPKYQQALSDIAALQQPVLDGLATSLTATMKGFLPNIKKARITIPDRDRSFALRGLSSIYIDDGVETDLSAKGDGVQSLAALAIMRHSSQTLGGSREILLALEEPESHLHPGAIRQLREVIRELSTRSQVILTTHNPIFTNRETPGQNIIVHKNRAFPAQTIREVRDILGVRLDDNLTSAETILIVEGESDRIALTSILRQSPSLAEALQSGRIALDVLAGAGNLTHRARLHSDSICKVQVFLDDDTAGRNALEAARKNGILSNANTNLTVVAGKVEAELEDLFSTETYSAVVLHECGLDWDTADVSDRKRKWSDRLKAHLRKAGKSFKDSDIMAIKLKVAGVAATQGYSCLHPKKRGPIDSLITTLELELT